MVASSSSGEDAKKVTAVFTLDETKKRLFYIPLPVGLYASLTVELAGETGYTTKTLKTWTDLTVDRAKIYTASLSYKEIEATTPAAVQTALKEIVTEENAQNIKTFQIALTNTLDVTQNSGDIEVPEIAGTTVAMNFAEVPTTSEEKPLVLKTGSATSTTSEAVNNVTVSMPTTTQAQSLNMTIDMPATTVEVAAHTGGGGDGTTTIHRIVASTASNTLIVNKGVTIETLIVKGGNVRVKSGSAITNLSRDAGNNDSSTIIYKEKGATLPDLSSVKNIQVVDAEIADLTLVAKNGGTYILNSDITLVSPLVVEGKMTLYLNGHSIKPNADGLTQVLNTKDALILVRRGAELIINDTAGGSIDCSGVASVPGAVKLTDSNDQGSETAKLTVNGGLIKGYNNAICGNGLRHGTEINITGGIITVADEGGAAIYHPQDGKLTVSGGEISGVTGIEIRSGELTVNNGTIKSTGAQFTEAPNGNGTTITGVAVAVSQHTTQKDLKVTIAGGTLEGPYALYEKDLQGEPVNNISLSVTAGTFKGGVFSEDCKAFITGGTFSDPTMLTYLAENANVNVMLDKDCTMEAFALTGEGQQVAMDLKEHTLTLSADYDSQISATASFKNGNIVISHADHKICGIGGKLMFDKVHISGSNYALWVQGPNATLDVINNSIIEANYFPVSTNASKKDNELVYGANATITLKNSTFIGTETGFMNNVPAKVTIEGCTFSGNHQAALLRGGEYTITNSTFTLKAELKQNHGENKHLVTWGAGNQAAFAGITIGNYKSGAYQYHSIVNMQDVTVKVEGTNASSFPAMHVCANDAAEKGVTLAYDNQCSFTSGYTPSVEYGTTNIIVNGTAVIESNEKFIVPEN